MWTDRLLKPFVISLIATIADSNIPIRAADPPKASRTATGAAKKPAASTAAPAKVSRTAPGAAPKPAASTAATVKVSPTAAVPPQKPPVSTAARPLAADEVWGHDYARAWQQSRKLNRPVLMHFHTTWCGPCRQMERDVLNSAKVLRELDARCIAVKVDCDKQPELTRQFGVEGLPCDILVTVDGKMHRLTHGFVAADEYSSMISKFGKSRSATPIDLSSN
ncbi:MAG TPA: thioredoxin domain-containing protein [Planctomycetaceae bacterium]